MRVPEEIAWLAEREDGAAWLDALPGVLEEVVEQWGLTLGAVYDGGMTAYVARATTADGTPAVLKVQWPHREAEHEAEALRVWDGHGAVRLLAHDPERHALLLERAEPGDRLTASPLDEAVGVIIGLVRELAVPVTEPFTPLADEAAHWGASLPHEWEAAGRPFESSLVDTAVGLLEDLAPTQGTQVLVHQDLHADNVVAAQRAPWLAIDPKPLAGEIEFAIAPLVRDFSLGHDRSAVRHRFDRACDELDLDADRARGWCVAQTVAWAPDNPATTAHHAQTARWLIA